MPWRTRAACAGTPDPDAFFPEPDDWDTPRPWAALALCAACVVAAACLTAGYHGREQGIWGGTTDQDRDLLRLAGWQPGTPRPPAPPVTWVPVTHAAAAVGVSPRVVHLWAARRQITSRPGRAPTGQPCRLVRVDQVAARAARARLPRPPAPPPAAADDELEARAA